MEVLGEWRLTPWRCAIHVPSATAVCADVHLGYGAARRRRGDAVPLNGLEDFCYALKSIKNEYKISHVAVAGDLCEDNAAVELVAEWAKWLIQIGLELTGIVPGNHDRGLVRSPQGLPLRPEGLLLGTWLVHHGDIAGIVGRQVSGHIHPCLRWGGASAPCYLVGKESLILPAFSLDAAGGNVLGDSRWHDYRCIAIVREKLLDFGPLSHMPGAGRGRRK